MALYTYTCTDCGKSDVLLIRKFGERDLPRQCCVCNGNLRRSEVECFAIGKKYGNGDAPQRQHGGTGIRIDPGVRDVQLSRCGFDGFDTAIKAGKGSSFKCRDSTFRNCGTACDLTDAECDIRDMDFA